MRSSRLLGEGGDHAVWQQDVELVVLPPRSREPRPESPNHPLSTNSYRGIQRVSDFFRPARQRLADLQDRASEAGNFEFADTRLFGNESLRLGTLPFLARQSSLAIPSFLDVALPNQAASAVMSQTSDSLQPELRGLRNEGTRQVVFDSPIRAPENSQPNASTPTDAAAASDMVAHETESDGEPPLHAQHQVTSSPKSRQQEPDIALTMPTGWESEDIKRFLEVLEKSFFVESTARICEVWAPPFSGSGSPVENRAAAPAYTLSQRCARYCQTGWASIGRMLVWPSEAIIAWMIRAILKNTLVAFPRWAYVLINGTLAGPFGLQMALHMYALFHGSFSNQPLSNSRKVLWALGLVGIFTMVQGTPVGAPTLPIFLQVVARQVLREVFGLSVVGWKVPQLVALGNPFKNVSEQQIAENWKKTLLSLPSLEHQENKHKNASLAAVNKFMDALKAAYCVGPNADHAFTTPDTADLMSDFDRLIVQVLHPYTSGPAEFHEWADQVDDAQSSVVAQKREEIKKIKADLTKNPVLSNESAEFIQTVLHQLIEQSDDSLNGSLGNYSAGLQKCFIENDANSAIVEVRNNLKFTRNELITQLFYKHLFRDAYETGVAATIPANVHRSEENRGAAFVWCVFMAAIVGVFYYLNPQINSIKPKPAKPLGLAESWILSARKDKTWVVEWGVYKFWELPNFEYVNIFASALAEFLPELGRLGRTMILHFLGGRSLLQLGSARYHQTFKKNAIRQQVLDKASRLGFPGFAKKTDKNTAGTAPIWQQLQPFNHHYGTHNAAIDENGFKLGAMRAYQYLLLPFNFSFQAAKCLLPKSSTWACQDWNSYKKNLKFLAEKFPGVEEMVCRFSLYNFVIPFAYRTWFLVYLLVLSKAIKTWPDPVVREDMANRLGNVVAAPLFFFLADNVNFALGQAWRFMTLAMSRSDALPLGQPRAATAAHSPRRSWFGGVSSQSSPASLLNVQHRAEPSAWQSSVPDPASWPTRLRQSF